MTKTAPADTHKSEVSMRSIIRRIATGPELSKDISQDEARAAMRMILEGRVDPVQAGVFLIALRMKRETDDENLGVLDALRDKTTTVSADVDEIMDIADPYDGYTRCLPASPFLPAVLAACGLPAVCHGVESVGPKYGLTHRQILRAAGVPVDLSPQQAATRVADRAIGWAYLDQKAFCPGLHALTELRTLIVKRPVLTTVETLTGPLRGRRHTHLMTGYVHKPYPRIYAMLARRAGFDSAVLVRGVEGGVIPSLRQEGKLFFYHDGGAEQSFDLDPATLGIDQPVRATPLPDELVPNADEENARLDTVAAAKAAAQAGIEALEGKPGATRDSLIYAASICLWHVRRHGSPAAAAPEVRKILDSGAARSHFGV
ncbi:MAG: anthranilate phosphoribosyltransferase [Acidiferrobacterales bacterium]